MEAGEKKIWIGELFSASSLRRMMIGQVESKLSQDNEHEGPLKISYVMCVDLVTVPSKRPNGQPEHHWTMNPDPALFSAAPTKLNQSLFLADKILDAVEDKSIISQYTRMVTEIRLKNSGIIQPQSPVMPGR